jgi:hypothetical protein
VARVRGRESPLPPCLSCQGMLSSLTRAKPIRPLWDFLLPQPPVSIRCGAVVIIAHTHLDIATHVRHMPIILKSSISRLICSGADINCHQLGLQTWLGGSLKQLVQMTFQNLGKLKNAVKAHLLSIATSGSAHLSTRTEFRSSAASDPDPRSKPSAHG